MSFAVHKLRVSSTLNRDVKMYGQKYMFDGSEETCWSSDSGSPQWIDIMFKEANELSTLEIQFQGGFVGQDCRLEATEADGSDKVISFYPEDVNTRQRFTVGPVTVKKLRVLFEKSTDFFGRIVIYSLGFS